MVRRSVPASSRWVAKLCRRVWTVTCLPSPAASARPGHSLVTPCRGDRSIRARCPGRATGSGGPPSSTRGGSASNRGESIDVAVLLTLGLADADDHPPAVDVVDAQGHDLGDAEPGGVGGHEDGTVLEAGDRLEELSDLVGAQDDGELLLLLGRDDVVHDPFLAEGDAVEEPQGGNGLAVIAPGDVLLLDEEEEIGPDIGCGPSAGATCRSAWRRWRRARRRFRWSGARSCGVSCPRSFAVAAVSWQAPQDGSGRGRRRAENQVCGHVPYLRHSSESRNRRRHGG